MQSVLAGKRFATTAVLSALLALAGRAEGADLSLPVTGNLLGSVVDATGTPQRGATVRIFNKYQRLVSTTTTSANGRFAFAGLPVDLYSVRVALASFLPAARDRVAIRAGLNSVLQIHLTTLFSSIEVKYSLPGAAMTDDWKWVLRSSPATRLITRYLPDEPSAAPERKKPIFSGTRAMVSLSGGDGGFSDSSLGQPELGTGFALATNVFGNNQLQVGGAFGQNTSLGAPSMGLCAIYRRDDGGGFGTPPEVTLTMSQFGLVGPQQINGGNAWGQSPTILRTMSLNVYNVLDAFDDIHIEYGMTAESVDYLQHTSRISPFARITVSLGPGREIIAAYSDGARPDELTAHQQQKQAVVADAPETPDELANTANTMARLPQISNRDGVLELQRTQSYELGYTSTTSSRTYALSAFHEAVSNGRINVAGTMSPLNAEDLLWDGVSPAASYNVGNYSRNGYIASADQRIDDILDFQAAYGRMGGFAVDDSGLTPQQSFLRQSSHNVAAASVKVHAPVAGTRIVANYGWIDAGTVVPMHTFTTQSIYISPGLNLSVRQPMPSLFGMPGHFELTADIRNLLAQGYLPLSTGSRSMIVVQAPRTIRGGVNFIF